MKKSVKIFLAFLTTLCVAALLCGALAVAAAPTGTPFVTEDFEKATGAFKTVRDTDRIPDTLEGAETFAFPYENGEKLLKVAKKSDSATKDYVIEGDQSIYFINAGSAAEPSIEPLITKGQKGTAFNFSPDKVYVARFLFKEISTLSVTSSMIVTVRTWDWNDPWVDFEIKPKASGGFSAKVSSNGRTYDKISVQKVGDDVYEVALRFTGLLPSSGEYCYLFWSILGQGGISLDGFKVYESKSNPNTFFELAAAGGATAGTTTAATVTTAGDNKVTTTAAVIKTTVAQGDTTQQGNAAATTTDAAAPTQTDPETTVTDFAPVESDENSDPEASVTTVQAGDAIAEPAAGLSGLAMGMLAAAAVVVVGCVAAVAVISAKKKKTDK